MRSVAWLSYAPVKGLRLKLADSVRLDRTGVAGDRRFYLVDSAGDRVGALEVGELLSIEADYDSRGERLTLGFPRARSSTARSSSARP